MLQIWTFISSFFIFRINMATLSNQHGSFQSDLGNEKPCCPHYPSCQLQQLGENQPLQQGHVIHCQERRTFSGVRMDDFAQQVQNFFIDDSSKSMSAITYITQGSGVHYQTKQCTRTLGASPTWCGQGSLCPKRPVRTMWSG